MPDVFHVYPDLVCSSGFQPAFDQVDIAQPLNDPVMGNCVFSVVTFRVNRKNLAVTHTPGNISFDGAFFLFQVSPNEGHIFPVCGFIKELLRESYFGIFRFCHHNQPGSILVDAVYQSGTKVIFPEKRKVLKVMRQCIDQGAVVISMSGMDHQPRLLVDDQ